METSTCTLKKPEEQTSTNGQFYKDVINGLSATPKRLDSKYFYDAYGDKIFQELMNCAEYYPTNCELEIFTQKTAELAKAIIADGDAFELIELGAGDATKSSHLLKYLIDEQGRFYLPADRYFGKCDRTSTLPCRLLYRA
jgi:L-histidine N-alpha-methyltransferase